MLSTPQASWESRRRSVLPKPAATLSEAGQEAASPPLSVLIVSDVRFFRDGLSEVLSRQTEMALAANADDADQALACTLATCPDAVLVDVALPDGLAAVTRIAAAAPHIPIIALAMTETEQTILAWIEAGITAYVPRAASIVDLVETVTRAVRGEQLCSTKVAGAMLRRLRQLAAIARQGRCVGTDAPLTPREREIAELVADGLSNKLIARQLHIEVATAKCHVHNVLDKLGLQRRGELAHWVRQRTSS